MLVETADVTNHYTISVSYRKNEGIFCEVLWLCYSVCIYCNTTMYIKYIQAGLIQHIFTESSQQDSVFVMLMSAHVHVFMLS